MGTTLATGRPRGYRFLPLLLPTTANIAERLDYVHADLRATALVLAIRQYEQEHGHPPATLEDVELGGHEMPTDPFDPDDGPFLYKVEEGEWVLWSRGPDGVDDGGTWRGNEHFSEPGYDEVYGPRAVRLRWEKYLEEQEADADE